MIFTGSTKTSRIALFCGVPVALDVHVTKQPRPKALVSSKERGKLPGPLALSAVLLACASTTPRYEALVRLPLAALPYYLQLLTKGVGLAVTELYNHTQIIYAKSLASGERRQLRSGLTA